VTLSGLSIVAGRRTAGSGESFFAVDPRTGLNLEPAYRSVGHLEIEQAATAAADAFKAYGHCGGRIKGTLLRALATRLEAMVAAFVERTPLETGLPEARVRSETARTVGQLRLFADLVEEGSWVDARVDHGDSSRRPAPRPDVRSMLRPTGPVAVFGAGNFPLAFSVAGGDTASALAAGCPVIVKAHPSHPGTSELVGLALAEAVRDCGLPEGVFSLLFDHGHDVGRALVAHPAVTAVAFTGSRAGGLALAEAATARAVPVPVFAEMSSTNPVFLLPGALAARAGEIADKLHASVTVGVGQLCTCPGLVVVQQSVSAEGFISLLAGRMAATLPGVMLSPGVRNAYQAGLARMMASPSVRRLTTPDAGTALWRTMAGDFLNDTTLAQEVFGPSTLVVECRDRKEMLRVAHGLEGQLTATVHADESELADCADLLRALEGKAGRLIVNGFPTGVEVGPAIVHGGPFPATHDGRSTSVGTRAILRFTRPICYQDVPEPLLPEELKDGNPLGIRRMVDGVLREAH
jgi:NADP-dependent aldehyde dehydrogenase